MSDWNTRLKLAPGQELKLVGTKSKGFMAETDITTYQIIDADGAICGEVTLMDHTAVKGFKRTVSLVQRDLAGKIIVEEAWNP
jgi:hypothetical protein